MDGVTMVDPSAVAAAAILLCLLSFVLILLLWLKMRRMNKRYRQMLNGNYSMNIEEMLIQMQGKVNDTAAGQKAADGAIAEIGKTLKSMQARVEVVRYNAFNQSGSDLSFSVAILNEYKDGVVLTGIYSREQTYMYAKPVEKGQSKYSLSPEEIQVIERVSARKEPQNIP